MAEVKYCMRLVRGQQDRARFGVVVSGETRTIFG